MYSDISTVTREETLERIVTQTITKTRLDFDYLADDDDDDGIAFINDDADDDDDEKEKTEMEDKSDKAEESGRDEVPVEFDIASKDSSFKKRDWDDDFVWIGNRVAEAVAEAAQLSTAAATDGDDVVHEDGHDHKHLSTSDAPFDFPVVRRQTDVNVNVPAHLLLASLIDGHLQSFAADSSTRRSLFNAVVDNLHRVGVMPKVFGSDEFSSLRLVDKEALCQWKLKESGEWL